MERGPKKLPTESKMLESTRAGSHQPSRWIPHQSTTQHCPCPRKTEAAVRQETQYKHHSQDWRQSLKENWKQKHSMGGKLEKSCTCPFIISEDLENGRFWLKTSAGKTPKQTIHCACLKFYHDSKQPVRKASSTCWPFRLCRRASCWSITQASCYQASSYQASIYQASSYSSYQPSLWAYQKGST